MVAWFEIPVTDMARAKTFYEAVFGIPIHVQDMNELQMGWFPFAEGKPGAPGSLVRHPEFYHPSENRGALVYFNCDDVQVQLDRIPEAGGTIVQEKKLIAEGMGHMALFIDTEGNRVALYSRS